MSIQTNEAALIPILLTTTEFSLKQSCNDDDFFIFILMSGESGWGAVGVHKMNPDSRRSCLCFRVFCLSFVSDFVNLLLVRFHQAEMNIVKHLSKDVTTRLGWESNHQPCDHNRRNYDAQNHYATADYFQKSSQKLSFQLVQFLSSSPSEWEVEGLEFGCPSSQIDHCATNGSPPLPRFVGAVLPRR